MSRADELHLYGPDPGNWVAGGPLLSGLPRADALARVRRCAAPGATVWYRWNGAGDARPLPPDDGRELPDLAVFAGDARDRHLSGVAAPQTDRTWTPDIDQQLAHARWLRRCGNCEFHPQEREFGCICCGRTA